MLYYNLIAELKIPWLLPSYDTSEIEDKFKFIKWMKDNSLTSYIPQESAIDNFPYILKIGNGNSAKYVYCIKNNYDLERLNFDSRQQKYICQKYIPGYEEYAHHFIALDGAVVKSITYKHIFSDLVKKGDYYIKGRGLFNHDIQEVTLGDKFINIINLMISKLQFSGAGCIDFKIYEDNIYIFEFNSRMGGSLVYFDHKNKNLDNFFAAYKNALGFVF